MKFNQQQLDAIYSKNQNILLIAGAGSGKTTVIIERIKYLIESGVKKDEILCITFTKKAADEMKSRIKEKDLSIYTFHAFCYKELKKENNTIQIFKSNDLYSEKNLLKISLYKNSLFQTKKPKIYDSYQTYLKNNHLYDFDDLILNVLNKISLHPYKHIFIDEFQDTNKLQFQLLLNMKRNNVSFFAVGDPDQSIYGFRGSYIDILNQYIKKFNAQKLILQYNYRSDLYILTAANNLIKHNKNRFKKDLLTTNPKEKEVLIFIGSKDEQINYIIHLIRNNQNKKYTILYRNHYQILELKAALEYFFINRVSFYTFHESKGLEFDNVIIYEADILPYLKDETFFNIEEERRLFFVGITRAKVELYITASKMTPFLKSLKVKRVTMKDIFY